ncbi:hypothetical protein BJY52DRAFT_1214594, partial [Lactarius psammicola]
MKGKSRTGWSRAYCWTASIHYLALCQQDSLRVNKYMPSWRHSHHALLRIALQHSMNGNSVLPYGTICPCRGAVDTIMTRSLIHRLLNTTMADRAGTSIRVVPLSTGLSSLSALSMDAQNHCPVCLRSFAEPLPSIGSPSVRPLLLPSTSNPLSCATSHIGKITRGHRKKRRNIHSQCKCVRHSTTIGVLPGNVLLEIFGFCRNNHDHTRRPVWKWHLLAHVCRMWRQIVFASPRRLNLQILCTPGTP